MIQAFWMRRALIDGDIWELIKVPRLYVIKLYLILSVCCLLALAFVEKLFYRENYLLETSAYLEDSHWLEYLVA